MGETILGMPGPWAKNNSEACVHHTTKIGGLPVPCLLSLLSYPSLFRWGMFICYCCCNSIEIITTCLLSSQDWPVPIEAIRTNLLHCGVCKITPLTLVAQIYAPITNVHQKIEERVIYILGCVRPDCGSNPNSWRALRFCKRNTQSEVQKIDLTMSGHGLVPPVDNSWSLETLENNEVDADVDLDLAELGAALSEAAMSSSNSRKLKKSKDAGVIGKGQSLKPCMNARKASMSVLPCFYICPILEQFSGGTEDICASYSSLAISKTESQSEDNDEAWEQELYEYDSALGADRTYLKFKKRMDANPEQCFRYSYGGRPLSAAAGLRDPIPCAYCGACRQFELQLMPPVLYFLREAADTLSIDNWNWLTIIIYSCSENCFIPSHVVGNGWVVAEEFAFVQYED